MSRRSGRIPSKAERLFLHYLNPAADDAVVDLFGGDAALAVAVVQRIPAGHLTVLTRDAAVHAALQRHIRQVGAANATVVLAASAAALPVGRFDLAYVVVRPYLSGSQLTDLLVGARRCLRPGGRLLLMAGMRQGAATAMQRAEELFGNLRILDKPGGTRIASCVAGGAMAPSNRGGERAQAEIRFDVRLRGQTFTFLSAGGVFSWGAVDDGTCLLLETADVHPADRIADVGCGYGVIGIVAARCAPAGCATLVDSDALAVELARRNIALNGVGNAEALVSDGLAAVHDRSFDLVLSNPPLHAGERTLRRLTEEAYDHLVPGGRLVYVVHKAYDARPMLTAVFGAVTTLAETREFRVVSGTRGMMVAHGTGDVVTQVGGPLVQRRQA
jgi:16S rRNA (guanine1207-N2)-methyltransferase